jgi:hypothetical protein
MLFIHFLCVFFYFAQINRCLPLFRHSIECTVPLDVHTVFPVSHWQFIHNRVQLSCKDPTVNFRCYSTRATQRATGCDGQIDGLQTSMLHDFMYQIRKVWFRSQTARNNSNTNITCVSSQHRSPLTMNSVHFTNSDLCTVGNIKHIQTQYFTFQHHNKYQHSLFHLVVFMSSMTSASQWSLFWFTYMYNVLFLCSSFELAHSILPDINLFMLFFCFFTFVLTICPLPVMYTSCRPLTSYGHLLNVC